MSIVADCGCGNASCSCCAGIALMTPMASYNRPGLTVLQARIGTHGSFLASMKARLSTQQHSSDGFAAARPLASLRVRSSDDPAIALLDAWATIADVLTFYQQRIVNEAYLRTATEKRSVHSMAGLIGYTPRPGVAASVFLSYTIDQPAAPVPGTAAQPAETLIPKGARVQTVPGQDELPQSFETSEALRARAAWNRLGVRQSQPQQWEDVVRGHVAYLAGTQTRLKIGDPLLVGGQPVGEIDTNPAPLPFRIVALAEDPTADRTTVWLKPWFDPRPTLGVVADEVALNTQFDAVARPKRRKPPVIITWPGPQPLDRQLPRALGVDFNVVSDASLQVMMASAPEQRAAIGAAIVGDRTASAPQTLKIFALRTQAGLFGRRVPKRSHSVTARSDGDGPIWTNTSTLEIGEWPIVYGFRRDAKDKVAILAHEAEQQLYLDGAHDGISANSWVLIDTTAVPHFPPFDNGDGQQRAQNMIDAAQPVLVARIAAIQPKISRSEYGLVADSLGIVLGGNDRWIRISDGDEDAFSRLNTQDGWDRDFQVIRNTVVYAKSEELALAEAPLERNFCADADGSGGSAPIELDAVYLDIEPGRLVIVSGECANLDGTEGVFVSEVARVTSIVHDVAADVVDPVAGTKRRMPLHLATLSNNSAFKSAKGQTQIVALAGDDMHSFVTLENPLTYCYRRGTVQIHGNVVKATHGETRIEVLGNGDGATPLQTFTLKQAPLTWLAAPTALGAESTLSIFVNDVQWRPVSSFIDSGDRDQVYMVQTDTRGVTSLIFGNGSEGARLPTGNSNVTAVYRSGIGRPGNVRIEQISQLATRPLGVKGVINPLRASGGADAEGMSQIRRNAPLAVTALDRLVSTRDYADFARNFAGIGKATSAALSHRRSGIVHITVAGSDDIPINSTSDLLINLRRALIDCGDPFQPIVLAARELLLLIISAKLRIHPDHRWDHVVVDVRAALLEKFGFDRRELGQGVASSEVLSVIQSVAGVIYVDLDTFGAIPTVIFDESGNIAPRTPDETASAVQLVIAAGVLPVVRALRARVDGVLRPAQLLVLTPAVPATLVLNQIV